MPQSWKSTLCLVLIFLAFQPTKAQSFKFIQQLGSFGNERIVTSCKSDGKTIIGLTYNESWQLGDHELANNGGEDLAIIAMTETGSIDWVFEAGGPLDEEVTDIIVQENGEVIVAGAFRLSMVVDGDSLVAEENTKALFLLKLDQEGRPIWVKDFSGGGLKSFTSLAILDSERFVGVGYFEESLRLQDTTLRSTGFTDGFIATFNAFGERQDVVQFGGSGDVRPLKVDLTSDGMAIAGGVFNGLLDFNGNTIQANTADQDLFLLSVDLIDLGLNWLNKAGGVLDKRLAEMYIDEHDEVYVFGNFVGVIDFDGKTVLQSQRGNDDLYFARLDSDGNVLMAKAFNHEFGQEAVDFVFLENEIMAIGLYRKAWEISGFSFPETPNISSFVLTFDYLFNIKNGISFTSELGSIFAQNIYPGLHGYQLLGSFNGDIQIAGKTMAKGGFDIFWIETDNQTSLFEQPIIQETPIEISYNSQTGSGTIVSYAPFKKWEVYEISGKKCFEGQSLEFNLGSLSKGIYLIEVYDENGNRQSRLIPKLSN